jgi:hypothetical protein
MEETRKMERKKDKEKEKEDSHPTIEVSSPYLHVIHVSYFPSQFVKGQERETSSSVLFFWEVWPFQSQRRGISTTF